MPTLTDTIKTELTNGWTAGNCSGSTPVFINLKDEDREQSAKGNASGEGEVVGIRTGEEKEVPADLARSMYIRNTPFTIIADSDTESIRDQYITEIKRIIRAKSIAGGHWEIGRGFEDDKIRDSSGIMNGNEMKFV